MSSFFIFIFMKHLIAPSMLAADFGNLQRDCEMVNHEMRLIGFILDT